MTYYIGLDCSSKAVHLVVLDEVGKVKELLKAGSTASTRNERLYQIGEVLEKMCGIIPPPVVGTIEAAIFIQSPLTTISVAQVVGVAKYLMQRAGIVYCEVDNKTWKKDVLGNGKAGKPEIKEFAVQDGSMADDLEQDYYDAYCLAKWGFLHGANSNSQ